MELLIEIAPTGVSTFRGRQLWGFKIFEKRAGWDSDKVDWRLASVDGGWHLAYNERLSSPEEAREAADKAVKQICAERHAKRKHEKFIEENTTSEIVTCGCDE